MNMTFIQEFGMELAELVRDFFVNGCFVPRVLLRFIQATCYFLFIEVYLL